MFRDWQIAYDAGWTYLVSPQGRKEARWHGDLFLYGKPMGLRQLVLNKKLSDFRYHRRHTWGRSSIGKALLKVQHAVSHLLVWVVGVFPYRTR